MLLSNKFSIGADPEFFIQNQDGSYKSIIGMIGGTKDCPKFIDETNKGFAIQEDNVAAEYNIPPTYKKDHLFKNIQYPMKAIQAMIGTDFTISKESASFFPEEELQHPLAQVFGCEPDFNAWTLTENPKPESGDKTLRTAGGHIHVGVEFETPYDQIELIKAMDMYLGVWSVIADQGHLRKQLYGKAGAFRPKPYGVEYRVLSNFWIFDKEKTNTVWNLTERAVEHVYSKKKIDNELGQAIVNCINLGDTRVASIIQSNWI